MRKLINKILFVTIYSLRASLDRFWNSIHAGIIRDLAGFWGEPRFLSEWEISIPSGDSPANVLSSKASAISNRIKVLAGYSRFCAHAVGAFAGAETCLWLVERVGRLAKGKLKISFKCSCVHTAPLRQSFIAMGGVELN